MYTVIFFIIDNVVVDEDIIADLAVADWGPWADLSGGSTGS